MTRLCSILSATPRQRTEAIYHCFAPLYFVLHPFVKTVAAEATTLLEDGQGLRALDVCTGTGVVADILADHGYAVTGIDLSMSMLGQRKKARKQRGIENARMDARRLAFRDDSFDVCAISLGLHEFSSQERRQIIREMARVSKKYVLVADYSGKQSWIIHLAEWAEASHFKDFIDGSLGDQLTQMGLHILKHNRWYSLSMYLCEVADIR